MSLPTLLRVDVRSAEGEGDSDVGVHLTLACRNSRMPPSGTTSSTWSLRATRLAINHLQRVLTLTTMMSNAGGQSRIMAEPEVFA